MVVSVINFKWVSSIGQNTWTNINIDMTAPWIGLIGWCMPWAVSKPKISQLILHNTYRYTERECQSANKITRWCMVCKTPEHQMVFQNLPVNVNSSFWARHDILTLELILSNTLHVYDRVYNLFDSIFCSTSTASGPIVFPINNSLTRFFKDSGICMAQTFTGSRYIKFRCVRGSPWTSNYGAC